MTVKVALNEIEGIVKRTTDNLMGFAAVAGRPGSELRLAVGDVNAFINDYIRDGTFGLRLMKCFKVATAAGITVAWMDVVLQGLVKEKPSELSALAVVQSCILFALAQDARILANTEFKSRDDVDAMLVRIKDWFDIVRDLASNSMDDMSYRALTDLAGTMTRYLADVTRPLPRMLTYELGPMPLLAASQYIYGEGDRAEELHAENKVVHPLFPLRQLRALSA